MKLLNVLLILPILLLGTIQEAISSEIVTVERTYIKEYDTNGRLKAEGWKSMDIKTGYWTFYHQNGEVSFQGHFSNNKKHGYWYCYNKEGQLLKEGHFENGSAEKWWIFYDIAGRNKSKFQFKDNQKNGFALRYKNKRIVKAEEYKNGKKINEWTSITAFRLDNPNVSF